MTLIPALLSAALLAGGPPPPGPAAAAGIAAYDRGDFIGALAILKPIVYDVSGDRSPFNDPWATAYLAQIFRRGEGTARDWPLSCALFNNVWKYMFRFGPGDRNAIPFLEEGLKEVCLPELQAEVGALGMACYLDGVTRREFVLDGTVWLVADRRGFHIDRGGGEHRDVPMVAWCHDVVISLTESELSIPDKWSTDRVHFLELFKWTNRIDDKNGAVVRALHWLVYLVRGIDIGPVLDQTVLTVIGGPYPSSELPPGVRETTVLRANDAGDVEWMVGGVDGKRGVIAAPRRSEMSTANGVPPAGGRREEPASDFAVRFDHKGCPSASLDTFKGTISRNGAGPVPFTLSKEQRTTLFNGILDARIFDLPEVVDARGADPGGTDELEVLNGGKRRLVTWSGNSADRSLSALTDTVIGMLNPNRSHGCVDGPQLR